MKKTLEEANQEIPDWFLDLPEASGNVLSNASGDANGCENANGRGTSGSRRNVNKVEGPPREPGQEFGNPKRAGACFNCGLPGHTARECAEPRKEQSAMVCFECGQAGHVARQCPSKTASKPKRRGSRNQ